MTPSEARHVTIPSLAFPFVKRRLEGRQLSVGVNVGALSSCCVLGLALGPGVGPQALPS